MHIVMLFQCATGENPSTYTSITRAPPYLWLGMLNTFDTEPKSITDGGIESPVYKQCNSMVAICVGHILVVLECFKYR